MDAKHIHGCTYIDSLATLPGPVSPRQRVLSDGLLLAIAANGTGSGSMEQVPRAEYSAN